ncbi:hypothetical protein ENBRE01_0097 [Enteropsectra breve]|nr:hypothetical protein ENBRE01_0097 [Enteropsectra breve]
MWEAKSESRYKFSLILHLLLYMSALHCLASSDFTYQRVSFCFTLIMVNTVALYNVILTSPGTVRSGSTGECPDSVSSEENMTDPSLLESEQVLHILMERLEPLRKYCDSCEIYRPRGVAHCTICNACILEKDHHCGALGTCIGKNNLHAYYCYILSLSGLLGVMCYSLIFSTRPVNLSFNRKVFADIFKVSTVIYRSAIAILFLFSLLLNVYYVFLWLCRSTSREFIVDPRGCIKKLKIFRRKHQNIFV